MGPEELLRAACELSYVVARDGAEALPRIDAPASMQSFLYVGNLPPRALTVAQQAIEEEPAFRRRVAERASEEEVGRAGFLWLHRPIGWAAEFEELSASVSTRDDAAPDRAPLLSANGDSAPAPVEVAVDAGDVAVGSVDPGNLTVPDTGEVEAVSAVGIVPDPVIAEADELDEVARAVSETTGSAGSFGSVDIFGNGSRGIDLSPSATPGRSEANAIEDELLTLRGLVDRLSHERKTVSGSVRQAEQDLAKARYQPSAFETDVYTLQSELEAARAELEEARQERDNAIRQHSDALTRQLELERELGRARELRAEIEREHAEADASFVSVKEALARAETSLATTLADRDELTVDLQGARNEIESLKLELARSNDTAATQTKTLETQYRAAQNEIEMLKGEKDAVGARLAGTETDLEGVRLQLSQVTSQAAEAKSLVDALTEEKIDLASRLADTEAMLETTRTQLAAVKSDAETLTTDLASTRNQRDALASQVEELHANLTEALNDLGRLRSTSDADRAALKEVRGERDLLRVRVSSLEQIEKGLEAKLTNLTTDRDAVLARLEQAKSELLDKDRAAAVLESEKTEISTQLASVEETRDALVAERDELRVEADAVRARATELELARDGLSVQVEQLTEENLAIQAQMVERERQQHESAENQGRALSELAHRLSMIENERNALESDLRETEEQLAEALQAVERAMETAEKARQEKADAIEAMKAAEFAAAAARAAAPSVDASLLVQPEAPSNPLNPLSPLAPVEPAPAPVEDLGVFASAAAPVIEPVEPPAAAPDLTVPIDLPAAVDGGPVAPAIEVTSDQPRNDGRPTRRGWGFGARFRGENDSGRVDDEQPRTTSDETPVEAATPAIAEPGEAPAPPAESPEVSGAPSLFPDQPALADEAVAGGPDPLGPAILGPDPLGPAILGGDPGSMPAGLPAPDSLPAAMPGAGGDLDLDSISSELAQAAERVPFPAPDEDEDLDEISKLIKQTVTDFDPSSLKELTPDPTAALGPWDQADSGLAAGAAGGAGPNPLAPPSVFNGGDLQTAGPSFDPDSTVVVRGGPLDTPAPAFDYAAPADSWTGKGVKPGRRQIVLPDGIEDEVEMARQVVASPDVVLLVDGDSVAKLGWPSLPVAQQRDALVSYLADLSNSTGASPDVVFDGRIGEEESLPASRAVRIRLSTPPTEPTAALDELVDAYPEQWPIAVVTDDEMLTRSARDRGATVLNNGQLLDLFIV